MSIGPFLLLNRFDVALNQGFYLVDKRSRRGVPVEGLAETGRERLSSRTPIINFDLNKPSADVPTASLQAAGPSINVTFAEWLP